MNINKNFANKLYVQFGSGNEAVKGWLNFDASPTLRIQRTPIIGVFFRKKLNCLFDDEIMYGDIIKGLPIDFNSVDGLFCSHILEHLTMADVDTALKNCFNYLKPGCTFRIIVPDLEGYARKYIHSLSGENELSESFFELPAMEFMFKTYLGKVNSRRGLILRIKEALSNSSHQWMWDYLSLKSLLMRHGFVDIEKFNKNECFDEQFLVPERDYQFGNSIDTFALAVQCRKPL
jgi:predicted SAM-dependent methyltransferase